MGKVLDLGLVPRYLWRVRPECSYSQECLRREDPFFLQAEEIVVFRSDILPLPSGKSRDYGHRLSLGFRSRYYFISYRTIKFTIRSHCGSKVLHWNRTHEIFVSLLALVPILYFYFPLRAFFCLPHAYNILNYPLRADTFTLRSSCVFFAQSIGPSIYNGNYKPLYSLAKFLI